MGDIERMVEEAVRYKSEDESHKELVEAKNSLEQYAYGMRSSIDKSKAAETESPGTANEEASAARESASESVRKTIEWLEHNQEADKVTYETMLKDLQESCKKFVQRHPSDGNSPS